nr:yolk protein 3, YP3s1 [Drosophila melanogaster, Peptide Partial, 19 aa] [Drosophila melanogaster]
MMSLRICLLDTCLLVAAHA